MLACRPTICFGVVAALAMVASPAVASSLPRVDFDDRPTVGVGFGTNQAWSPAGSVSLDIPVGDQWLVGGAVASTLAGGLNGDLRLVYRFVEGGTAGPTIAAIAGVWGEPLGRPMGLSSRFSLPGGAAPLVGFGLAYPVWDRIHLRLNLIYSPFFLYGAETLGFIGGPPGSGLEVGYELNSAIQATLGINGRGDVLGLKIRL